MSDHGPLFDNFTAQAGHDHDGSYFDSFERGSAGSGDSHGTLFDEGFREGAPVRSHGERWDRFDWKPMPVLHGTRFDESFSEPSAHSTTHGAWFDAFRGGAVARFIYDGADFEGQIIKVNEDYATVRTRKGQEVEVGFPQFLEYATPNMHQAGPPVSPEKSPGQAAPRVEVGDPYAASGMENTALAVKSIADLFDVAKTSPPMGTSVNCANCGVGHSFGGHGTVSTGGGSRPGAQPVKSFCSGKCASAMSKSATPWMDVLKAMDSTETAVQGEGDASEQSDSDDGSHWCSHCKHTCRKAEDGKCPTCGHEVVAKSWESSVLSGGADVPLRAGSKASDHHMQLGAKHTTCPHCGKVYELIDEQTAQGAPHRKERTGADAYDKAATAHKCIGSAMDVLKEAWS